MSISARSFTSFGLVALLVLATAFEARAQQQRDWRVHSRGMLHQTIFNTGELGRPYSAGGTIVEGRPSLEWPSFSRLILDRQNFPGQHNSFGSGVWLAATREDGRRLYSLGGAVSNSNGDPVPVVGVHSSPVRITRMENYPVLASGDLNPAYNPDEAEEIIISEWDTPAGIRVTRTSRAWSYPGYDSFIIYEYEFTNRLSERLRDVFVTFASTFGPSMFGYQRNVGEWTEGGLRGQPPAGLGDHFARFDLKRWMTYNHEREGQPERDQSLFNTWRQEGNRGGLNSPQAAGMTVLYYDHELLARRGETDQIWLLPADTLHMWDATGRPKQPFMLRYENGNLYDEKVAVWMDPNVRRRTSIFQSIEDSTRFANQFEADLWNYWRGRTSSSANLSWWQPVARGYGFYPFILEAGQTLRFAVAEVVGYGAGSRGDEIYRDLGGSVRAGVDAGAWFNPVSTWYNRQTYPHLGSRNFIGSDYLQNNPLPWYVHPDVVSVRDVADRAIEAYTGRDLVKHDTLQYDPPSAPSLGRYNTIPIPFPAPVIRIENTSAAANRIIWGSQVESFSTPRLRAPFSHYEVLRAPHPLGPWSVLAEVEPNDARFLEDGDYAVLDIESNLGDNVAYAVVSVDQQGGRSGKTNLVVHETQAPPANALDRVYVVPNPLIVSSGLTGTDAGGDISDRIQFMGLTDRATIRIFSYTGQLIETIEHDRASFGNPWYQLSINNQLIASGVYFFVVEDHDTGARANGKFVVIH
jgi:hypothetical protein